LPFAIEDIQKENVTRPAILVAHGDIVAWVKLSGSMTLRPDPGANERSQTVLVTSVVSLKPKGIVEALDGPGSVSNVVHGEERQVVVAKRFGGEG